MSKTVLIKLFCKLFKIPSPDLFCPSIAQYRLVLHRFRKNHLSLSSQQIWWFFFKSRVFFFYKLLIDSPGVFLHKRRFSCCVLRPRKKKVFRRNPFLVKYKKRLRNLVRRQFTVNLSPLKRKKVKNYDKILADRGKFLFFYGEMLSHSAFGEFRLDFPSKTDGFHWPLIIKKHVFVTIQDMWSLSAMKAEWSGKFLRSLAKKASPLWKDEEVSSLYYSLLQRHFFTYYLQPTAFCQPLPPPPKLFSGFDRWSHLFFFFWSPLWHFFDQTLIQDYYYSPGALSSFGLNLLNFFFRSKGFRFWSFFFFNFIQREIRFWFSFFRIYDRERRHFRSKRFFKVQLLVLFSKNPRWAMRQLDRLLSIIPFLPVLYRASFLVFFRKLFSYYKKKVSLEEQLGLAKKNPIHAASRLKHWFTKQKRYFKKINKQFRGFFLAKNFRRLFPVFRILRRLIFLQPRSLLPRRFFSLLKKNYFFKIFHSSFLSNRFRSFSSRSSSFFSFRRKLARFWSRFFPSKKDWWKKRHIPPKRRGFDHLRLVTRLNSAFIWRLLLFWSIFFYIKLIYRTKIYSLSLWLSFVSERKYILPLGYASSTFHLWDSFNKISEKFYSISFYSFSCLYWLPLPPINLRRRSFFRRTFRKFFYRPRSRSFRKIPHFYRKFRYIRRMAFSKFFLFWNQRGNFIKYRVPHRPKKKILFRKTPQTMALVSPAFLADGNTSSSLTVRCAINYVPVI